MPLPKFKNYKPTPAHRFAFAFWLGWAFHLSVFLVISMFSSDVAWPYIAIAAGGAMILMSIYTNNRFKFEKEFTWMTIKTPEKDNNGN